MKKSTKVFCILIALGVSFALGWRIMPKVWPDIKKRIVYPIFPQMVPTPAPTQEPYIPKTNVGFGDSVSESDSVIYYFYKDYCPHCRALEPLTSGLPKHIILPDGMTSEVKLICLNKVEDRFLEIITGYYENHRIPEDKRYVPAMVIGEKYLITESEIINKLMDYLMAGEGLKTQLLNGSERKPDIRK